MIMFQCGTSDSGIPTRQYTCCRRMTVCHMKDNSWSGQEPCQRRRSSLSSPSLWLDEKCQRAVSPVVGEAFHSRLVG